ncbi:hypothetical protein WOLCODRAFT_107466 [Wolfiporia cocos MD-104 SS10]|uniref:Uncharacterized protein n=1 Tax=Wolfiporia cocos (strain MD-104) TaxID=742152 RepID=A0A2H3J0N9_WOLCO|nr:hypothetical protein WOLCODRAFT_107466 [Wolfiporia cocos MD-104 SS10]
MPNFEEESLPYVRACRKELFLRKPQASADGLLKAEENKFYQICFIPKGSIIYGNVWDPGRLLDPMVFGRNIIFI